MEYIAPHFIINNHIVIDMKRRSYVYYDNNNKTCYFNGTKRDFIMLLMKNPTYTVDDNIRTSSTGC